MKKLAMASTIVKDIDEKFCQCSICLDQFKEPKLLPCLHRFCKECLGEVIKQSRDNLPCPVCRDEFIVPKEGLDDIKTDFYMKNIIEYVQLQKSLEDDDMQECYSCSKTVKVSAYCFKCNGFLCEACHQFHVTSKITKDHRPHTLAVEDGISKSLTLGKLASLKEVPRCYTHSEKLSEVCCKSCNNSPICMTCTYGIHKGHDFYEVTKLANEERHKLKQQLAELCSLEKTLFQMPKKIIKEETEIRTTLSDKIKIILSDFADQNKTIEDGLQNLQLKYDLEKAQEQKALKDELGLLQTNMEKEIQQIKMKYNKICDEKRTKSEAKLNEIESQHKEQSSKLNKRRTGLDISCKTTTRSIQKHQQDYIQKIQKISAHFGRKITRYKNLKDMAFSILDSEDDWTTVQCIPDIFTASRPLIEEMRGEYPELVTLTDLKRKTAVISACRECVHITNQPSEVTIEGFPDNGWDICDMTTTHDGSIVISGKATSTSIHLSVVNINGEITHKRQIKTTCHLKDPECFCDYLLDSKVVTGCDPDEIGIFDIRCSSHFKKNVSKTVPSWSENRGVSCVAVDISNREIFVGDVDERDVYIFSENLDFLRTLKLPDELKGCHSMTVQRHNVIVCDDVTGKAVAMDMKGNVVYEFMKPADDSGNWRPVKVCSDSRGFLYILWCSHGGDNWRRVVVQNSLESENVLRVIPVDDNAFSDTIMKANNKESLLVATVNTGKLTSYDLVP